VGAVQERNWFYGEPGLGFYRAPGLGEIGARSGPLRAQHTREPGRTLGCRLGISRTRTRPPRRKASGMGNPPLAHVLDRNSELSAGVVTVVAP
jgi:hypothetical protein